MRTRTVAVFAVLTLAVLAALPAAAQDAKLSVCVKSPTQAYVFVDGRALGDGTKHNIRLAPGPHEVGVYNYGYKPFRTTVNLVAGEKQRIDVILEPVGGSVNGPWGRIQIEGAPRHAVLLNGKTPDYLVGHGDEFNHDWIWKQELIVPPGTHQVTLIRDGKTTYEQEVSVAANQRVIINAGGSTKTTDWPRGNKLSNLPRFKAGLASATVAVAPVVINSFTATPPRILCEDSSRLAWQTTDTVDAWINNETVATSGEQLVTPLAPTTYTLSVAGPGGRASLTTTVDVEIEVQATLGINPDRIRYARSGSRVIEHGTAELSWTTHNATTVTLDPLGPVSANGSRTVQPTPPRALAEYEAKGGKEVVQVNETITYTLNASNKCGGSATRTANLRIEGILLPPLAQVHVDSIFFPTDYPDERHPNVGLLRSEKAKLQNLVGELKIYLENDPAVRIKLEAHTDPRRSAEYNQRLAERRAAIVRQFLVDAGVPSARFDTQIYGLTRNLPETEVDQLIKATTGCPDAFYARGNRRASNYALNRRVDLVLAPDGESSTRHYSCPAQPQWRVLWQLPKPARSTVERTQ